MLLVTPGEYGNVKEAPPADAANHPLNEYPDFVGVDPGAVTAPPETNVPDEIELPPCESKVTL
jgi:hypothetical protein